MTHHRVYKIINLCGSCQEAEKKIGSNLAGVDYFLAYFLMWLNKIYAFQLVDNYIKNSSHYPMQGDCKYISGRLYKVSRWLNYDLQWYLSAFFNNFLLL